MSTPDDASISRPAGPNTESTEFEITITHNEQRYERALKRIWWRRRGQRLVPFVLGAILIVGGIFWRQDFTTWIAIVAAILTCGVCWGAWHRNAYVKEGLAAVDKRKDDPVRMTFSPKGIAVRQGPVDSIVTWRACEKLVEYSDMWLIHFVGPATYVIPEEQLSPPLKAFLKQCVRAGATHGRCPSCGYDLRKLTSVRCPECGSPLGPENLASAERNFAPSAQPAPSDSAIVFTCDVPVELVLSAFRNQFVSKVRESAEPVAALTLCCVIIWLIAGRPAWWLLAMLSVFALICLIAIARYFVLASRTRKAWMIATDGRHTYCIDDTSITFQSDVGAVRHGYDEFARITRRADYWLLHYRVGSSYYIIPTSAITPELRRLLTDRIEDSR